MLLKTTKNGRNLGKLLSNFSKKKLGSISKLQYIQKSKKNGLALVQHNMKN
ncbi:hypothetical protein LguiB_021696 [Lonicera macranthoides]